ncbi:hypothetical protein NI420_004191 [Salmonella enterica]|nr:hypothetical protein [Salmonella enterica]EJJ4249105.1 hypothetical protein [Salmonella enterica]
MKNIKYLASFKTERSACMIRINDFPVMNNFTYSSGTITTGFNITSFIENGKNKIDVMMGPVDPKDDKTLYSDSTCELIITKDTIDSSQKITSIIQSVNNGKIISTLSSNYNGTNNETRIIESQSVEDKDNNLYKASREIIVDEVPEWSWVNATPVLNRDLPAIKEFYIEIGGIINNKDISRLEKVTEISSKEMGAAQGVSSEFFFKSFDFSSSILNKKLSLIPLDFNGYKLITYGNGRVFRLAKGVYQNSPLKLRNEEGEIVHVYNPYLSIINGRIVIVR